MMDSNLCFHDCLEGGLLLFPSSLIHQRKVEQEPGGWEHKPGECAEEAENSQFFAARRCVITRKNSEGEGCLLHS